MGVAPKQITKAVAYYRVSTARQGQSGLGIEAQQASVEAYAASAGLEVIEAFIEVETGTRKRNRPQIEKAVAEAKKHGAVLLIAKIDRLARSMAFISNLMESGADFVAVDMPEANRLTVHLMAALAEHEARLISVRTRDALAAAKKRGTPMGTPENLTRDAQLAGAAAMKAKAIRETKQPTKLARTLRRQGLSLREIARELNDGGFVTRTGKAWNHVQVKRILDRALTR